MDDPQLVTDDLSRLDYLITLGQRTRRVIAQAPVPRTGHQRIPNEVQPVPHSDPGPVIVTAMSGSTLLWRPDATETHVK
jgi:hypothetical protein